MAPRPYRYISHTADVSFIAYGKSFRSALENSALALLNVMLDIKAIRREKAATRPIRISDKAKSREDAVWYLLQDVLSRIDAEKLNAFGLKVVRIKEREGSVSVTASLMCKRVKKDFSLLSVKAVTPHDLTVKKGANGYSIRVVVDV